MKGERILKFGDIEVWFDESSTINFEDTDLPDEERKELRLQPSDLSVLYAAYRQMEKEECENKKW